MLRLTLRRASLLGLLLLTIASSAAATIPARAAEGDSARGFPHLDGEWYFTQPAVIYASAPPSARVDESLMKSGLKASYLLPDGGAPVRGQGDIAIVRWADQSHPSNAVTIDFAAFESLETDLRTTIVGGLALPMADGSSNPLDVQFSGSVLTVTRKSDGCGQADVMSPYKSQVALLGSNGFKYLVDLDLNLGKRPPCSKEKTSEAAPAAASTTPPAAADSKVDVVTETAAGAVVDQHDGSWLPIIAAAALLALLLLSVKLIKSPRRKFKADGTLANSPKSGAAVRHDPPPVSASTGDESERD